RRLLAGCGGLLAIDLLLIASLLLGGGGTIALGETAVSVGCIENPVAAAGLLIMAAATIVIVPGTRARLDRRVLVSDLTRIVVPTLVCVILIVPLGAAIVSVWRKGGYVSQAYLWRSAPAGVDPGPLVLGNPRGAARPGGGASTDQRR